MTFTTALPSVRDSDVYMLCLVFHFLSLFSPIVRNPTLPLTTTSVFGLQISIVYLSLFISTLDISLSPRIRTLFKERPWAGETIQATLAASLLSCLVDSKWELHWCHLLDSHRSSFSPSNNKRTKCYFFFSQTLSLSLHTSSLGVC